MIFDNESGKPRGYIFDSGEKHNQNKITEMFDYVEEMREANLIDYETDSYSYFPKFGMSHISGIKTKRIQFIYENSERHFYYLDILLKRIKISIYPLIVQICSSMMMYLEIIKKRLKNILSEKQILKKIFICMNYMNMTKF